MGRAPCCDKANVKKGPWSTEEDATLKDYIEKNGTGGNWIALPQKAGLRRCGKSCRLRWLNYLRPNIKHGDFSEEEDKIICGLYASIGSRWSIIAAQLPGRTDNDVKNYWNTTLKKKLLTVVPLFQKKLQGTTSSFLLQNNSSASTSSSSSTSPLSFKDGSNSFYKLAATSFTCPSNSISFSPSTMTSNSSSFANPVIQESYLCAPSSYQGKYNLMFGGEGSCSSDGSCSNQIRQSQEAEYEYACGGDGIKVEQTDLLNYLNSGVHEIQKSMFFNGCNMRWWTDKQNELWGENPSDFVLQEIEQQVSTSSGNNLLIHENKTAQEEDLVLSGISGFGKNFLGSDV